MNKKRRKKENESFESDLSTHTDEGRLDMIKQAKRLWSEKRKRDKQKKREEMNFIVRFCSSEPGEFKILKMLLLFPIGLIVSTVLYLGTIHQLDSGLDSSQRGYISSIFVFLFALPFSLYPPFRNVICLIPASLFGGTGRLYLSVVLVYLFFSGPVLNLFNNLGQMYASTKCGIFLLVNHTKMAASIHAGPLLDMMISFMGSKVEMLRQLKNFTESLEPIEDELNPSSKYESKVMEQIGSNDRSLMRQPKTLVLRKKYQDLDLLSKIKMLVKNYVRKLELRCLNIFEQSTGNCVSLFSGIRDSCYSLVPDVLLLKKRVVCSWIDPRTYCSQDALGKLFPATTNDERGGKVNGYSSFDCNFDGLVGEDLGTEFSALDSAGQRISQLFNVDIQYQATDYFRGLSTMGNEASDDDESDSETEDGELSESFVTGEEYYSVEEAEGALQETADVHLLRVKFAFKLFRKIIPLLVIFLIFEAHSYHERYLTQIDFDNRYLTGYFFQLDRRRRAVDRRTLLPLKYRESSKVVPRWPTFTAFFWTEIDWTSTALLTSWTLGLGYIWYILVIADVALTTLLDLALEKGFIEYKHYGRHSIKVEVVGSGFFARMFRGMISREVFHKALNVSTDNRHCLPKPSHFEYDMDRKAILICLSISLFLMTLFGRQVKKTCSWICETFYRKRSKRRILYLYNDLLRRRIGYLAHARHRSRRRIKLGILDIERGYLERIRLLCPERLGWLRCFRSGRHRCLVCRDLERKGFIKCRNRRSRCPAVYCGDCWKDIKARCYLCRLENDWSSNSSDKDEDEYLDMPDFRADMKTFVDRNKIDL